MNFLLGIVVWLVLSAAWTSCGRLLVGDLAAAPPLATAVHWMSGSVAWHLGLQSLDLIGVPWSQPLLAAVALVLLAARAAAAPSRAAIDWRPWALSLPFAGLFFWGASTLRAASSDFVYHWGIKGKRFAEVRGIDWDYLRLPDNGFAHPDYPMLVSEQFASLAILTGVWDDRAQFLWSLTAFALLLHAAAGLLLAGFERAPLGVALHCGLAASLTAFCLGYFQAGSADLHIALPLLVGAGLLATGRRDPARAAELTLAIGGVAAFAASSKIEGIPFAFGLLGLCWWLRRLATPWKRFALAAAPAVLAVLSWWLLATRYELFQPTNLGSPNPFRWPIVQEQIVGQLRLEEWHRLPWLILLSPLLLSSRRSRAFGLVAGAQLALFLYVYVAAPVDPVFWIVSSFPRALLQILPTALVGLALLLGVDSSTPSEDSEESETPSPSRQEKP